MKAMKRYEHGSGKWSDLTDPGKTMIADPKPVEPLTDPVEGGKLSICATTKAVPTLP